MRTIERGGRVGLGCVLILAFAACAPPEGMPGHAAYDVAATPPRNAITCTSYGAGPQSAEIGHRGGVVAAEHRHQNGSRRHAVQVDSATLGPSERLTFTLVEPVNGFLTVIATHNGGARGFDPRVGLRIGYDGCDVEDPQTLVMYRRVNGDWLRVPDFRVDERTNSVWAPRDSLSQYALGAG